MNAPCWRGVLVVLVLDAASALAIPEAATGARTPLATEVAAAGARLGLVAASADAEEDGGDEEADEGCPGKGVGVGAYLCRLAVGAELRAAFDCPGA